MTPRAAYILGTLSAIVVFVVLLVISAGVSSLYAARGRPVFTVQSDFPDGRRFPDRYACAADGGGGGAPVSPPLRWSAEPRTATSLVILLHHPSVIRASGVDPVHWLLLHVPVGGVEDVVANIGSGGGSDGGGGGGGVSSAPRRCRGRRRCPARRTSRPCSLGISPRVSRPGASSPPARWNGPTRKAPTPIGRRAQTGMAPSSPSTCMPSTGRLCSPTIRTRGR